MQRFYQSLTYFSLLLIALPISAKTTKLPSKKCETVDKGPGYFHRNLQLEGLAPGRINTCGNWDFSFAVSFLYWKTMGKNMEIASLLNEETPPVATTEEQKMKFDPGFKLSIWSNFYQEALIAKVEYTRLHTSNETKIKAQNVMVVNPGFSSSEVVQQNASFVSSFFKVNLDVVDFSIQRPSYFGKRSIFTPFAGPKLGFIDQRLRTETLLDVANAEPIPAQYDTDSWFIGPKLGVNINYILGYGFKTIASLAAALLYEEQKIHVDFYDTNNVNDNILDFRHKYRFFCPNFETSFGFSWGSYFAKDVLHIGFFATYDVDLYSQENTARSATLSNFYTNEQQYSVSSLGKLVFHGLKAGIECTF